MSRYWPLIALYAGLVGIVAYGVVTLVSAKPDCKALTTRAAITTRAAELCTGDLVACPMTFAEVAGVLADQVKAKEACE